MAFSGVLTLTDLNDFITPSQACIKPVEVKSAPPEPSNGAATQIQIDGAGIYYEVGTDEGVKQQSKKLERAEISLNDCLACSGCITSAESVLITLQSHEEVLNFLKTNPPATSPEHKLVVLSVSPQSIASLAAKSSVSIPSTSTTPVTHPSSSEILTRIRAFATSELGFDHVFDTTLARHLALREHILEFQERTEKAKQTKGTKRLNEPALPMLASACPGWVCYAEKTHAEMLPFIATTKSPQQVMGTLIKEWIGQKLGKSPDQIYHVTVMPCYDKKLEASRQDFYNEQYRTRDVDCVITTGELELLMKESGWDLNRPLESSLQTSSVSRFGIPDFVPSTGSSSGGWLQAILNSVQEREAMKGKQSVVKTKIIRTADYEDVWVEAFSPTSPNDVEVVFRGAKCYGFRNLQNVVRKVGKEAGLSTTASGGRKVVGRGRTSGAALALRARRAKAANGVGGAGDANAVNDSNGVDSTPTPGEDRPYDYVEVMACPAGCVNGGGQLRRPIFDPSTKDQNAPDLVNGDTAGMGARWGDREWVKTVEETYWRPLAVNVSESTDDMNSLVHTIYEDIRSAGSGEEAGAEAARKAFRTQYRAVVSDVVGLNVNW